MSRLSPASCTIPKHCDKCGTETLQQATAAAGSTTVRITCPDCGTVTLGIR
jgi:predicted RNA-binding Zn-ribbon protein involved in translation (DUF1610 family)